jgi:hypothetical protein
MSSITITLTDHAPIKIKADHWPMIAEATAKDWDGEYEECSDDRSYWHLRVRQHADGRAVVYADYSHETCFPKQDVAAKRGVMLEADGDIIAAIRQVAAEMAAAKRSDDDDDRWPELAAECIAHLPAVEIK